MGQTVETMSGMSGSLSGVGNQSTQILSKENWSKSLIQWLNREKEYQIDLEIIEIN